jgi:hypothetical protein
MIYHLTFMIYVAMFFKDLYDFAADIGGDMAILAAITNRSEVARYLKHLGIEHEAPARAPPRYQEEPFEFGTIEDLYESLAIIS